MILKDAILEKLAVLGWANMDAHVNPVLTLTPTQLKRIVRRYGHKMPKTMAGYAEAIKKVKQAGVTPIMSPTPGYIPVQSGKPAFKEAMKEIVSREGLPKQMRGSGILINPLVSGRITEHELGHRSQDIARQKTTPLKGRALKKAILQGPLENPSRLAALTFPLNLELSANKRAFTSKGVDPSKLPFRRGAGVAVGDAILSYIATGRESDPKQHISKKFPKFDPQMRAINLFPEKKIEKILESLQYKPSKVTKRHKEKAIQNLRSKGSTELFPQVIEAEAKKIADKEALQIILRRAKLIRKDLAVEPSLWRRTSLEQKKAILRSTREEANMLARMYGSNEKEIYRRFIDVFKRRLAAQVRDPLSQQRLLKRIIKAIL